MYMKNVIYKMLTGCYMVVALLLVGACSDNVDIQQSYPFSIETMPVPKKLKVGETAEIRCQLHRDGRFEEVLHPLFPTGRGGNAENVRWDGFTAE